jgi:hypothetical protein
MSTIEIVDGHLVAHFTGADVVRARRFTLKVPLEAIRAVKVGIPAVALKEPSMLWGTYDLGELLIGSEDALIGHRECFYEVRHPAWAITLELSRGRYEYVVLEPANATPDVIVGRIEAALGRRLPDDARAPGLMSEPPPAPSPDAR